jgi:hypothetical protein
VPGDVLHASQSPKEQKLSQIIIIISTIIIIIIIIVAKPIRSHMGVSGNGVAPSNYSHIIGETMINHWV